MLIFAVIALFNGVFIALDWIVFPGFRKKKVEQPVFIVGNARSGTTFFHRLMCGDENRFISFHLWELMFPSIIQQKAMRGLFGCHKRLLPRSFNRLVEWEKKQMQDIRKIRPTGIDEPDEDEFLFTFSFSSAMLIALLPYIKELEHLSVDFGSRPARTRHKILNYYRNCVRRLLYVRGANRTLLSKNPAFVGKMRDLASEFPDARFIYLYRDPRETIPSVCKLFEVTWQNGGFTERQIDYGCQSFIKGSVRDYEFALAVINELPKDRCAIVRYEDLISDPKSCIENVYMQLGLTMSADFADKLSAEGARQKCFRSANDYLLEEYGISKEELCDRLTPVMEGFGKNTATP